MPDDPPNEKATPEPKKESTTKMSTRMQLAIHIVALLSVLLLCGTLYGVCSNDTDTTNKKSVGSNTQISIMPIEIPMPDDKTSIEHINKKKKINVIIYKYVECIIYI